MKRIGLVSTIFVASAAFFAVVMACEALSAEKRLPSDSQQIQLSFAPLVRKVAPAVVNIYTRKVVRSRQFAPLFDDDRSRAARVDLPRVRFLFFL